MPDISLSPGHGVRGSIAGDRQWPGLTLTLLDLIWETEPGWIGLMAARPCLCFALEELGGRCQLRMEPHKPVEDAYLGDGHLSLLHAGGSVAVQAAEMRRVRLAVFTVEAEVPAARLSFQDERLHTCAVLLCQGEGEAYEAALRQGLGLALAMEHPVPTRLLAAKRLEAVLRHIRDHLDRELPLQELADLAGLAPGPFGRAFALATGQSPRRWQMDARVRCAQRLILDDPAADLGEVAALAGFSDRSHLTRAFRAVTGEVPGHWRRRHC